MRTHQLLDDLQALVERSGRLPGLGKKSVDERRFYSLLGQLREALPADLREATRITQESESILAAARAEAERTLGEARDEASRLVEDSELKRQAQIEADEILRRADLQADEIRNEAHVFAAQVLDRMSSTVNRIATTIEEGRTALGSSDPGR